jgi:hypothetical protein
MTVDEFAEMLRNPATTVIEDGWYHSKSDQQGYWAMLTLKGKWYWYRVSNTDVKISPLEAATAITSPLRHITRSNPYKAGRSFEATVKCCDHWYMLGHGIRK